MGMSPAFQGLDNWPNMQVAFLRMALGSAAVPCPQIDVGPAFGAIVKAALGPANMNMTFSPYDNDLDFLLGELLHLFAFSFQSLTHNMLSALKIKCIVADIVSQPCGLPCAYPPCGESPAMC